MKFEFNWPSMLTDEQTPGSLVKYKLTHESLAKVSLKG